MSGGHTHDHAEAASRRRPERVLFLALVLTASFMAIEFVSGLAFQSLALTADAAHMLSDSFALLVALIAQRIAARPASHTHTFGWRRIEVIAAFANGLLLLGLSLWIVVEAVRRIGEPADTNATGLMAIAAAGLVVNLIAMLILRGASHGNMNVRAALLHTFGDAAGSVGALVAGIVLAAGGPEWADPVASIVIATLVAIAALRLLRETTGVLMESTPQGLDAAAIEAVLSAEPSVMRVHHLHVWTLAPGLPSLSAHVELSDIETLHEAQSEGVRLKKLLVERFGIEHSTLELECHPCDPGEAAH